MKKLFALFLLLAAIPLLLFALSKSQEIRGKAANTEIVLYGAPEVSSVTQTQALIKYVTTGLTTTFIAYDVSEASFLGTVENMGRWRVRDDREAQTIHSYLLSGLVPGTTYFFVVSGFDAVANKYINPSKVMSFKTHEGNKDCLRTDLNNDKKTDLQDAAMLQKCLNTVVAGECKDFDLNGDGNIGVLDINLVTDCF